MNGNSNEKIMIRLILVGYLWIQVLRNVAFPLQHGPAPHKSTGAHPLSTSGFKVTLHPNNKGHERQWRKRKKKKVKRTRRHLFPGDIDPLGWDPYKYARGQLFQTSQRVLHHQSAQIWSNWKIEQRKKKKKKGTPPISRAVGVWSLGLTGNSVSSHLHSAR